MASHIHSLVALCQLHRLQGPRLFPALSALPRQCASSSWSKLTAGAPAITSDFQAAGQRDFLEEPYYTFAYNSLAGT